MAVDVQEHVQDQGLSEHHSSGPSQRSFYGPADRSLSHAHAKVAALGSPVLPILHRLAQHCCH